MCEVSKDSVSWSDFPLKEILECCMRGALESAMRRQWGTALEKHP